MIAPAQALGAIGSGELTGSTVTVPASTSKPPPLYRLSARRAIRIAERDPKARRYLERFPRHTRNAFLESPGRWRVSFYAGGKEVAQVVLDDATGLVVEVWTGPQVAWTMARGIEGAFGRKVTRPWVWVPLMVLFVAPFFDPRRPFRLLHLDLLVLLAFSVSHYFFNRGEIFTSVPLAYPVLAYLLVRMLLAAYVRRMRERDEPLRLLVPASWLVLAVVFLVGFRIGLNVVSSNVIDVGYSGVIGADRLVHGESLYGNFPGNDQSGDTYGPVNYYAYVPFELALPWHGRWDDLPAAHAAALFFDLGTIVALYLLGLRLRAGERGRRLGIGLAYAWAAYPYTIFVSNSNSNDSLVALLLVLGFLGLSSAGLRGGLLALASATKFAPLALLPLWGSFPRLWRRPAAKLWFGFAFAAVGVVVMLPVLLGSGLDLFWDRTLGFQLSRGSPFSFWGQHPIRFGTAQEVAKLLAAGFALLVALLPRRKSPIQLAALTAAVLIALQLTVTHWFYLYIVWFFPFVMVVLLGQFAGPRSADALEAGGSA